ncbi:MAG: rRNA maturation RNase YbeY [Alphaproteobacteria bacterium]|nr:rRNA maturation RNase YbeY [Alphaproteobacteria bacterium]
MSAGRLRTVVRVDHESWQAEIPDAVKLSRQAARKSWALGRQALDPSHFLSGTLPGPVEISVLLSDNGTVRSLNRDHLGKDKATNVLSFPGEVDSPFPDVEILLGDIVLAWQIVAKEAQRDKKPVAEHMTHLVIHGVLHLLGYDHECEEDAAVMERLEVNCMASLGLSDPYATGD